MRGFMNNFIEMKRQLRRSQTRWAYLCLLPSMLHFAIFIVFPVVFAFYLSFRQWDMIEPTKPFVGFGNYSEIFSSPDFHKTLFNTIYYTVGSVPTTMIVALFLAILLNQEIRGRWYYRTGFYIPVVTSIVAASIVWMWIYEPNFGVLNFFLRKLGLPAPTWLRDPNWAMPAVIFMRIWKRTGFCMIIYLAGLQGIPTMYYEAARIDGAGKWQSFWYITLPLLAPTTFFLLVINIVQSFQVFTQIFVMTEGGPMNATNVVVYYLYEKAFIFFEMGKAASVAYILFAIILVLTILQWKVLGRKVQV